MQQQFIKQYPDSYLRISVLMDLGGRGIDVSSIELLYKVLSASVRNTNLGLAFAKSIDAARATSIDAIAPEFTQNDVDGKPVSLTDFRAKYMLLDFWSW